MDFSVIIPSRNRPDMLRVALQSVVSQSHDSIEVVVVNDGSDGDNEAAYAQIAKDFSPEVRFLTLESTKNGHGQSYAINRGVEAARGEFVCFLDDDDWWIDAEHLSRAAHALNQQTADIYYSNQVAYLDERQVEGPIWIEGLENITKSAPVDGVYKVSIKELMDCSGFAHLNTSIVRRNMYLDMGGMDEGIRYECDWDFFLRAVDHSTGVLFYPGNTSHHNAPDPSKTLNMSTAVNMLQKLLYRSYVLDKAILFSRSDDIVNKARQHKTYTLQKITQCLVKDKDYNRACFYAHQATTSYWDIKWQIYTLFISLRSMWH